MKVNYNFPIDRDGCVIPPITFSSFMIDNIITVSRKVTDLLMLSKRVAKSNAPILITGDSGVGKELLAEYIHKNCIQPSSQLIKLNCAAIPTHLMESEFFGYESGAFTGASKNGKKGVVELANGGTLFLDEIGEMTFVLQAKLLRILQDGTYIKLGGEKELKANIRVIAATNKNLEDMIDTGNFREDLYFRLNVIPLHIPSLIERCEDIPILILYFLSIFNKQYNTQKKISVNVMDELIKYWWPGNIRELKNLVERLVLVSIDDIITSIDLKYTGFDTTKNNINNIQSLSSFKESLEDKPLGSLMEEYEKKIIIQTVKKYGTIRKAAKALKVSPSTLSRKLSSYNNV